MGTLTKTGEMEIFKVSKRRRLFIDRENFHFASLCHSSHDLRLSKTVFPVAVYVIPFAAVFFEMKREALLDPVTYKSKQYDLVYWSVGFF